MTEGSDQATTNVVPLMRSSRGAGPRQAASLAVRSLWRHRWFALAVALILGVAGWQAARAAFGVAVVTDVVERGDLIKTVVASGNVETPFRVEIGSQITGIVSDVLVDEGQRVVRGQPLVAIESSELKAAVSQAQGAVAQAEARMRQLQELTLPSARETLRQAEATQTEAQRAYDRTAQLAKAGHATQASLDDARKNLDIARTQVRTAELLVYTNSPGGSDYVMAQTQLSQAQANLETARSRLGYATIVAPRDGVLIARNVERGTVVQPGKALLVLAPSGETQLDIQIDEKNLGLIALGQKALASADAYPDRTFPATVSYINPGVDITRASIEVKLSVPQPPDYLRQDMTVSVDIDVGRRDGVLVAPLRDIHDSLSGSPWALVVKDGRAYKVGLRLGLTGTKQAEVVSGLGDGELLIPATAGISPGQRVRPVSR